MNFSKVLYGGMLASVLFAVGFGPEGPTAPDLRITGIAAYADGTPVNEAASLNFSVTVTGDALFTHSRGCGPVSGHRQGLLKKQLETNSGGGYALELSSEDFISQDSSLCASSGGTVDAIDVLKLEVSLSTNFKSCEAFCRADRPEHVSSCLSECTTGNRKLLGTKLVMRDELQNRKAQLPGHWSGINEIAVVLDHYSAAERN